MLILTFVFVACIFVFIITMITTFVGLFQDTPWMFLVSLFTLAISLTGIAGCFFYGLTSALT